MTLPAGITTCTVTIGKALGSLGEDASLSGTLTLDRRLVWSATGDTLYGVPSTVTPSQSGGWLSFIVAHVDQAGFVDQSGNSITGFSYTFSGRATFADGSVEPIVKHFQVFVGQSTLDLDLLPDGPVTLPVSTPIPPVDNAAVAGFVTNAGATKDALSASIVEQVNDPTSALRILLESLYGGPVGPAVPTQAASGPGWSIKAGSLDRYRTSKADPTKLTEVVIFGDSTTQGSGDTLGGFIPEVRRQAISAEYGDGGIGLTRYSATADESGEGLAPVFATTATGVTNGNQFDLYNANTPRWSGLNTSVTFQGRGTRLRVYYSSQDGFGRISYAIDGGAAVVVDTTDSIVGGLAGIGVREINGLSDGLHKVVVTNLGRVGPTAPETQGISTSSPGAPSGFSSGNYYYIATGVTSAGETLPSTSLNINVPNGPRTIEVVLYRRADPAVVTSYRFYRSTTGAAGSFRLVGTTAADGDSFVRFTDDNTATPGALAPTTDTSGLPSAVAATVGVDVEWTRAAGIVFHNQGVSGIDYQQYFSNAFRDVAAQAALGRVQGGTVGAETTQPAASSPPWRTPALAISVLGINNQHGSSADTTAIHDGAEKFAKFCVDGGIDGVLVVPHFEHSIGDPNTAANRAVIIDVANTYNLSWVAFDQALTAGNYTGVNQHLDHDGYVLEALFLWSKVLVK